MEPVHFRPPRGGVILSWMTRLACFALLALQGCYLSNGLDPAPIDPAPIDAGRLDDAGLDDAGSVEDAGPTEPARVDVCMATDFAWLNPDARPASPGFVRLFANYPRESPDYVLDRFGEEIEVVVDAVLERRLGTAASGLEGIERVVFARDADETHWRIVEDPDAVCPPLPEGDTWFRS